MNRDVHTINSNISNAATVATAVAKHQSSTSVMSVVGIEWNHLGCENNKRVRKWRRKSQVLLLWKIFSSRISSPINYLKFAVVKISFRCRNKKKIKRKTRNKTMTQWIKRERAQSKDRKIDVGGSRPLCAPATSKMSIYFLFFRDYPEIILEQEARKTTKIIASLSSAIDKYYGERIFWL